MAWPYDENGDAIVTAIFKLVWSRPTRELVTEAGRAIAASVLGAVQGWATPQEWTLAGQLVASRVASLSRELQRALEVEALQKRGGNGDLD